MINCNLGSQLCCWSAVVDSRAGPWGHSCAVGVLLLIAEQIPGVLDEDPK